MHKVEVVGPVLSSLHSRGLAFLQGSRKERAGPSHHGQLIACSKFLPITSAAMRNCPHERREAYTKYLYQGKPICPQTFRLLHCIGTTRLKNIANSLHRNGIQPHVHCNKRRLPKHLASVENVMRFLLNYFELHVLVAFQGMTGMMSN